MKIDGTETAPSGKPRLKIYLGEKELEIMAGLVRQSLRFTSDVPENKDVIQWTKEMDRAFKNHFEGVNQGKLAEKERAEAPSSKECITVCFDGGTPCNIPRLGFGDGYGSFRLSLNGIHGEIHRLQFGEPMSANTAEIRTVTEAIKKVSELHGNEKMLHVIGDSQIALKWVKNAFERQPMKISSKSSPAFGESIRNLYSVIQPFQKVVTEWNPRDRMVQIFGH